MPTLPDRKRENYTLKRYKDKEGKFRWNQKDKRNGAIVGASSEAYSRAIGCWDNLFVVTGWDTFDVDCVASADGGDPS